jgi:ABC-type nitrate/sulfonate/bicarbonate transport system ATPase subunit
VVALGGLDVTHLSKTFLASRQQIDVLDDVSMRITPTSFVSVVGPSGCGKTTLLHIIAGLDEPSSGTITWEVARSRPRPADFGYMFQRDQLLPWLKVADNVGLGLRIGGMTKEQARQKAASILKQYGLGEFVDAYPFQLSGGMRQRAALMRTLLLGRAVILLDEPFGNLDALTKLAMQQWLISLWERDRHTVLFVTHDINEAVFLSDRVIALSARPGRVILDLDIDLARPRTDATLENAAFIEYTSLVRSTIMSQV